jgi:hypothetical protein
MPSVLHEAIVHLFRTRPSLAAELLETALRFPLPPHDHAEVAEPDLTQTTPSEYRADLIVRLSAGARPTHALVVEVQLARDDEKTWTWPLYAAALRARERVPVSLLVVAPDDKVAAWASRAIPIGHPGWALTPIVLRSSTVPKVTTPEVARRAPELAVLSALAHGKGPDGAAVAVAAMHGIERLAPDMLRFYNDLVESALSAAARAILEKYMANLDLSNYDWPGQKLRQLDAKREGFYAQLRVLGFVLSPERAELVSECTDDATVMRWIERIVTATTVDDIFAD